MAEKSSLLSHVATCSRCRERLREEQCASERLRKAVGAPSESVFDLESRLICSTAQLVAESTSLTPMRSRTPFLAAAAAAVFALGIVSFAAFQWLEDPSAPLATNHGRSPSLSDGERSAIDDTIRRFLANESSPRVVELERDSRGIQPVSLRSSDPGAPTFSGERLGPVENTELGIETWRRRHVIVDPSFFHTNSAEGSPSSRSRRLRSSRPSASAGQRPGWSIELERVETRLVRYANDPWQ